MNHSQGRLGGAFLSFHVEWASIHFRYGEGCFGGLPDTPEEALQQRMEPDLDVFAMVLGK